MIWPLLKIALSLPPHFLQACSQVAPYQWGLLWSPDTLHGRHSLVPCPALSTELVAVWRSASMFVYCLVYLPPLKWKHREGVLSILFPGASLVPKTVPGTYYAVNINMCWTNEWMKHRIFSPRRDFLDHQVTLCYRLGNWGTERLCGLFRVKLNHLGYSSF